MSPLAGDPLALACDLLLTRPLSRPPRPPLPRLLRPPQLGSHPIFARVQRGLGSAAGPVYSKASEAAETLRERWETSDSPLVHRIQVWAWGVWAERSLSPAVAQQ